MKWSDVDWNNNQIHVQRTYNKGIWFKPRATASKRKIDIGKITIRKLKKWKRSYPASKLGLIFPNKVGGPISQTNLLRRHFYQALKAVRMPSIRFYDLHHSYASLLIDQGENIKYVQTRLGHSKTDHDA